MTPRLPTSAHACMLAVLLNSVMLPACTAGTPPAAPPSVQRMPPAALSARPEGSPMLVGPVTRVVDGDTINVKLSSGVITVRMASIDAPEYDQPGGAESTAALARRVLGREVEIDVQTQDQYDRLVAFVYLGGENLNSWQVQQGHAWAYRQYLSDLSYCVLETDSRTYRRGLWSAPPGSQKAPWEWRRAQREDGAFTYTDYQLETVSSCVKAMQAGVESREVPGSSSDPAVLPHAAASPVKGPCLIKGNISESGKVYHLPGSDWYERTEINTRKGERWFCTETEARAAGWRAAR